MVDVHAHLNFEAFKDDWRKVIKRSFEGGIRAIINVGSNFATSQRAVEIAKEFKGCWAAVGLHPIHVHPVKSPTSRGAAKPLFNRVKDEEFELEKYTRLVRASKDMVKAIGETGLDYFHLTDNIEYGRRLKELQKKVFIEHLKLAKELNLPVILHCRGSKENPKDAYLEMIETLKMFYLPRPQTPGASATGGRAGSHSPNSPVEGFHGEIHCFSAQWKIAREFLDLGAYIGFTGPITFKNADRDVLEVVKKTPLDKILAETDCPFLAPEPYRGRRNEPAYVRFVIQKIAEIKNLSFEETEKKIDQNAKELFNL